MNLEIGTPRRDGKIPVTLTFEGAPNAFGGRYPSRVFRKLYDEAKVRETVEQHGTEQQRAKWLPKEPAAI